MVFLYTPPFLVDLIDKVGVIFQIVSYKIQSSCRAVLVCEDLFKKRYRKSKVFERDDLFFSIFETKQFEILIPLSFLLQKRQLIGIPVTSIDPTNKKCAIYYPCTKEQSPAWNELVIFQKEQAFPRFWIELVVDLPKAPSAEPSFIPTIPVSTLLMKLYKLIDNQNI